MQQKYGNTRSFRVQCRYFFTHRSSNNKLQIVFDIELSIDPYLCKLLESFIFKYLHKFISTHVTYFIEYRNRTIGFD